MKNIITFTITLFVPFLLYSQQFSVYIFAEDAIGNRDTIVVGFNENATIGIDTIFGENNIYGQELNDLDLRVIQRDSINHNCLYNHVNEPVYYPENIDSKIDIHGQIPQHMNGTMDALFEFQLNSLYPPIIISCTFIDYMYSVNSYSYFPFYTLLDKYCNLVEEKYISSNNDSIFMIADTISYIKLDIQQLISIKEFDNHNQIKIYPNPASDIINISVDKSIKEKVSISIYNINGTLIKSLPANYPNKTISISTKDFAPGIYFCEVKGNDFISREKFVVVREL